MVVIKISLGEDIRRFEFDGTSFSELNKAIANIFADDLNNTNAFLVKYEDEDKDLVTISSDIELKEAITTLKTSILRLTLIIPEQTQKVFNESPQTFNSQTNQPTSNPIPEEVPKKQENFLGLDQLLTPLINSISQNQALPNENTLPSIMNSLGNLQPILNSFIDPSKQYQNPADFFTQLMSNPMINNFIAQCNSASSNSSNVNLSGSNVNSNNTSVENPFESFAKGNKKQQHRFLARFVNDMSIPDGSSFFPNQKFVKTWRIRNEGNTNWPNDTVMEHVGGDFIGTTDFVEVPPIAPGAEVDVSVEMVSPSKNGRYISYWRLTQRSESDEKKRRFGQRMWADIVVVSEASHPPYAINFPKEHNENENFIKIQLNANPTTNNSLPTQSSSFSSSNAMNVNMNETPKVEVPKVEVQKPVYSQNVQTVIELGFEINPTEIEKLLKKHNDNVQLVIDELLSK